jgi:N-acetylmuramoyl-L-alanine amidase
MSSLRLIFLCLALACGAAAGALAQGLTALARVDTADSVLLDDGADLIVDLALSQPVPWRAYTLDAPRRLVVDFSEARFDGRLPTATTRIGTITTGPLQPGWSRMVVALDAPLAIAEAGLDTSAPDGRARLTLRLTPVSDAAFAAASGTPADLAQTLPEPVIPAPPPKPEGRLRVVLDPGHGGIDPGAEYDGLTEADLMLTFARELRELLVRAGFDVAMTRDADVFVPLEARVTFAREAGADVFLSLHADSLPEEAGSAHGATVYVLGEEASDVASRRLAERHDGADLVAGVDVTGQGDEIALVLMDMARVETEPRTRRLAEALIAEITAEAGRMNHRPLRSANFSVLRSPSVPSVLVELGFLSSEKDRAKIADPAWRTRAATGIRDALGLWAAEDAARAPLLRTRP